MDFTTLAEPIALPDKLQLNIVTALVVFKMLGEAYSAIRTYILNGGGLRRMILSLWFGENLPKPVAEDYKDELSKPAATK